MDKRLQALCIQPYPEVPDKSQIATYNQLRQREEELNQLGQLRGFTINVIKRIAELDRAALFHCLDEPNCQDWFLWIAFAFRQDHDDELSLKILHHINCPREFLALAQNVKPEWVAGSDGMAEIQLSILEDDARKRWESHLRAFNLANCRDTLGEFWYSTFLNKVERKFNLSLVTLEPEEEDYWTARYRRVGSYIKFVPKFILEGGLATYTAEKEIAHQLSAEKLQPLLSALQPRAQALAAARKDLAKEALQQLADSKAMSVRKAVAANSATSVELTTKLAQDKSSKVAEAALNRLPDEIRDTLQNGSNKPNTNDKIDPLTILRLAEPSETELLSVVSLNDPLYICAATLHSAATAGVITTASKLALPVWARLGIASKSTDSDLIAELIASEDSSTHVALSDNPVLTEQQAITLVNVSANERVQANIANRFIDNDRVLDTLVAKPHKKTGWLALLKLARDEQATSANLKSVHNSVKYKYTVLTRLIARHPNCPEAYYEQFAYYLKSDLALNPTYALEVLEYGEAEQGYPFKDWKIEDYLNNSLGHEYFYEHALANLSLKKSAKVMSASINPNLVRHLVVSPENVVHRRMLSECAQTFSEYEYRMLARVASKGLRKSMALGQTRMPTEVLLELVEDADKSIARAAQAAVRLELAKESQDLQVLAVLVTDKTADVRAAVANRTELTDEQLFKLLTDDKAIVLEAAVKALQKRELNADQRLQADELLKQIFLNSSLDKDSRTRVLGEISDTTFLDTQYEHGRGQFDREIVTRTSSKEILESAQLSVEKGNKNLVEALLLNSLLSDKKKMVIAEYAPNSIGMLIAAARTAEELITLHENFGSKLTSRNVKWTRNEFTTHDLDVCFERFPLTFILPLFKRQLYKLSDERLIKLLVAASRKALSSYVLRRNQYRESAQILIFNYLLKRDEDELMQTFLENVTLAPQLLERVFSELKGSELILATASIQKLSSRQLSEILSKHDLDALEQLLFNKFVSIDDIPTDELQKLVDPDHHCSESVRQELARRGISAEDMTPQKASTLLKFFDAKISAVKFNKLMQERGYVVTNQRESESDPNVIRESKKLSATGKRYGKNTQNYHGDYSISYFPHLFAELLENLGVSKA